MAGLMTTLLTGDALSEPSRQRMIEWMVATRTGQARIRAGLPADWRAGDKTGSGIAPVMSNKYNDIAIAWPPGGAPLIVTAYYEGPGYFDDLRDEDQAVLAEVGRIAADWIRPA
jgi:beta-lactamase class A